MEGLQGKCSVSKAKPSYFCMGRRPLPGVGQSCKKLPVYRWTPGWVVYTFMLMLLSSQVAQAQMLWRGAARGRSMTKQWS